MPEWLFAQLVWLYEAAIAAIVIAFVVARSAEQIIWTTGSERGISLATSAQLLGAFGTSLMGIALSLTLPTMSRYWIVAGGLAGLTGLVLMGFVKDRVETARKIVPSLPGFRRDQSNSDGRRS